MSLPLAFHSAEAPPDGRAACVAPQHFHTRHDGIGGCACANNYDIAKRWQLVAMRPPLPCGGDRGMSGAMLSRVGGTAVRTFGQAIEPRRTFGRRRSVHQGARSVDCDVADMRRRIGRVRAAMLPSPLSLALGGVLVAALSGLLWLDAFQLATTLSRELATLL